MADFIIPRPLDPPACVICGDDGCGIFFGDVLCPSHAEARFEDMEDGMAEIDEVYVNSVHGVPMDIDALKEDVGIVTEELYITLRALAHDKGLSFKAKDGKFTLSRAGNPDIRVEVLI